MIKSFAFMMLLTLSSVGVLVADNKDKDKDKDKNKVVSMPEPSAVPEFLVCLAGIGYIAYRQRSRAVLG
jgi:hypothetical protein